MTANSVGRWKMPVKGESEDFSSSRSGQSAWLGVSWGGSLENRRRVGSTPPVQETPAAYLAVAVASRGHPFTTHPEGAFFLRLVDGIGFSPNSPSFGVRLPYKSSTPDASRAARSRPSSTRACSSRVICRASSSWLSRRDWISLASFRAASSWARQCSNAGRSSRLASAPASSASQWAMVSANGGLGMTPLLSLRRYGWVVLLAGLRSLRRGRRLRSLGLPGTQGTPGLHAELRQGLVGGAEADHREGLDLPGRLAPVLNRL